MKYGAENRGASDVPLVSVVPGRDLGSEDLRIINEARLREFGSKSGIEPRPDNEDWDKLYFLARHNQELVAFGRLHKIPAEFRGVPTTILGIATIVALKKGKGYGGVLMEDMRAYIEQDGRTAVGFCDPSVSAFYEKCGYGILKNGAQRFTYRGQDGQDVPPRYPDNDVLYIDGTDGMMAHLIEAGPDESAVVYRAAW